MAIYKREIGFVSIDHNGYEASIAVDIANKLAKLNGWSITEITKVSARETSFKLKWKKEEYYFPDMEIDVSCTTKEIWQLFNRGDHSTYYYFSVIIDEIQVKNRGATFIYDLAREALSILTSFFTKDWQSSLEKLEATRIEQEAIRNRPQEEEKKYIEQMNAYKQYLEIRRKDKQTELRKLVEEISNEPRNGSLHYDYAIILVSIVFPNLNEDTTSFWEKISRWAELFEPLREAEEHLNLALALGLSSPINAAKAKHILLTIQFMKSHEIPDKYALKKFPYLNTLANDIVADCKKVLRLSPNDLVALKIQRSAYVLLGNNQGIGKVDIAITKAESLKKAGFDLVEQSRQSRGVPSSPINDGIDFENRVLDLVSAMGLRATSTKTTGDGGIDILAYNDNPILSGKFIIQCKDWGKPIPEAVVRDLYGVVISEGANKGILITTGEISKSAESFASGKPLELIDGKGYRELLARYGGK